MKQLEKIILVQYFLFDGEEIQVGGDTAWLGPNGAGKTSILDAIQIVLLGANLRYLKFNTQTVNAASRKNHRSIRDYCLGVIQSSDTPDSATDRRRDTSDCYIALVFKDDQIPETVTIGVSIRAESDLSDHTVNGLFVLPNVELGLNHFIEAINGESMPLRWKDFEHLANSQCSAAGRTALITSQSETYIREMLHAIQPRAKHINPGDFMRALKKSVTLRDIESVDQFVRDFLIEVHSIDKHKALSQIEEFKRLDRLVKRTQEQIRDLTGLSKRYGQLARIHREMATMDYLSAKYDREELYYKQAEAANLAEEESGLHAKAERLSEELKNELETLNLTIEDLNRSIQSEPSSQQAEQYGSEAKGIEQASKPHLRTIDQYRSTILSIFGAMNAIDGFTHSRPEIEGVLNRGEFLDKKGVPDLKAWRQLLDEALTIISANLHALERDGDEAKDNAEKKHSAYEALLRQRQSMEDHGVMLSENTSTAIQILKKHGIECEPVCKLVRLTQPEWQAAVESYLKGNRESLIIHGGRERDAVKIIRRLPDRQRIYDLTIVQPEHLKQQAWNDPQGVLVGSLITGTNPVAVNYLRQLFGQTRMVDTEEELERHPRALTIDGMLSANGGTRALRLITVDQFLIGAKLTQTDVQALQTRINNARNDYLEAKSYLDRIQTAVESIRAVGKLDGVKSALDDAFAELFRLGQRLRDIKELANAIEESDHVVALRQQLDARKDDQKNLDKDQREAERQVTAHNINATNARLKAEEYEERLKEARSKAEELAQVPDYDQFIADEVEIIHEGNTELTYDLKREDCDKRRRKARERAERALPSLVQDFDKFLAEAGVILVDERKDWRLASTWTLGELDRLENSKIHEYQTEVDNAKRLAEEAFRTDVAVRIAEAIQRTKNSIEEINKILKVCPPFSNGETYQFVAEKAETYKSLYDYIETASKGADLFTGENAVYDQLIDYLKQSGDPEAAKQQNPLDDYRLLFTFDLLIKQNDKVVSRLSKRIGPGSNGEHRTPFYVIAGASLAAAYRIRYGEKSTGAALMLLDEAFHGMDSQNSLATAKFLRDMGLQLLIAAPDSEFAKFSAICDTTYDIARFGLDVYLEQTKIKEAGHRLMTSDMPSEHPELITQLVSELEAAQ